MKLLQWTGLCLLLAGLPACDSVEDDSEMGTGGAGGGVEEDMGGSDMEPTSGDSGLSVQAPEIVGTYDDPFGGVHAITAETWTQSYPMAEDSVFHFLTVDNTMHWAAAENDAANEFSPSLFSRFDWTTHEGALYYCQTAFDKASAADAEAVPAAESADPSVGGCAGFPWTQLAAQ